MLHQIKAQQFYTNKAQLKGGCSIVRELHVYGSVVPVHARDPTKFQHQVSWLLLLDVTNQTQTSEGNLYLFACSVILLMFLSSADYF